MARMRTRPMKRKNRNSVEDKMISNLDSLAEFNEFQRTLLPIIKGAVKSKDAPKAILELARSYAAARIALIMATDPDNKTALAAAKDLLDRTEGKAVERRELRHSMANLKDEELDALVMSKIDESEE